MSSPNLQRFRETFDGKDYLNTQFFNEFRTESSKGNRKWERFLEVQFRDLLDGTGTDYKSLCIFHDRTWYVEEHYALLIVLRGHGMPWTPKRRAFLQHHFSEDVIPRCYRQQAPATPLVPSTSKGCLFVCFVFHVVFCWQLFSCSHYLYTVYDLLELNW